MVLVTGASGFLGRHLVKRLSAQNGQVRALFHHHPPVGEWALLPGVDWQSCDLLDVVDVEKAMEGISRVYHCAAVVSYDPARRNELLHFNPESTANLVNEAMIQGVEKMVYVSSIAAIGSSGVENKTISEQEEWGESRYSSAYGLSKYLAETEVWRGIGEGLNAVIVNPGIMLGTCQQGDAPAMLLKMAHNEFPFFAAGMTSWVDVSDVVEAMIRLMGADLTSERFILSAGNFTYREVMEYMAAAMKKKPAKIRVGKLMAELAWRWNSLQNKLTGRPLTLTRETAHNAMQINQYNNEKFLRAFPDFVYTPVKQSVIDMTHSSLNIFKN